MNFGSRGLSFLMDQEVIKRVFQIVYQRNVFRQIEVNTILDDLRDCHVDYVAVDQVIWPSLTLHWHLILAEQWCCRFEELLNVLTKYDELF